MPEPDSGKVFVAKLFKDDGSVEEIELINDLFFLDVVIEKELDARSGLEWDVYWVDGHAVAYNVNALLMGKKRNGHASATIRRAGCEFDVYGDVIFIPRRYIRETPLGKESE